MCNALKHFDSVQTNDDHLFSVDRRLSIQCLQSSHSCKHCLNGAQREIETIQGGIVLRVLNRSPLD